MDTPLGPDKLGLRSFSFQEHLGRLFQIDAELSSDDAAIDFTKVVGHNATIRLQTVNDVRYFNGYVSRFVQVASSGNYAHYRATLVPWLWMLTRTAESKIWVAVEDASKGKAAPDIIEDVFKLYGFSDYKLDGLSRKYPKREFCVQYRETAFNFVSRLMEQEGIYYYFTHENGKHTLILADSISAHKPQTGYEELPFFEVGPDSADREAISEWAVETEVQPIAYAVNDFDFTKSKTALGSASNVTRQHGSAVYEVYDYPGDYAESGDGDQIAATRLDELQAQYEIIRGLAGSRGLAAGYTFKLTGHPRSDQNRECLLTAISLHADGGEFGAQASDVRSKFFSCNFTAIDKSQQFRPKRLTAKPLVQGPQTAFVVGKSGEEIDTDKFGRVKLLFHWDRYSKADENSSCWVRVAQTWAGKKWGSIHIPRIGQEVIVEFIEGDPDRPIITGRVYNDSSSVPYALPDDKTKSTLKSNSSKGGGGFNEIRFEDKKGSEEVYFHAEKDEKTVVKNDVNEWIGNIRNLYVKKDQLEMVEGDKHNTVKGNRHSKIEGDCNEGVKGNHLAKVEGDQDLTVKGEQKIGVTGDSSFKTDGNLNQEAGKKISIKAGTDLHGKSGQNYAMEAGMNVHIKGGMKVVIEAGMQLSIKAGSCFVDLGPSGVSISGPMVMINSGGAAGSGDGSSPTAPTAPDAPDAPKTTDGGGDPGASDDPPTPPTPPTVKTFSDAAKVLDYAAADGTPFCEECARTAEVDDPPEELPQIVSIAWLNGADDAEVSTARQWVNLPSDAKWVDADNGVANKDRLGEKVRFKVHFSIPGSHSFKVHAEAGDDNVDYSDAEKGRNAKFNWEDKEKTYTTESDGTKIVTADFFTTCAGKDTFKLIAEDTNNNPPVETGFIEVRRLCYLVPIKMTGMTNAADLSPVRTEFGKSGVETVILAAAEIDRMANIGPDAENAFRNKCKTAFDGSAGKAKSPYAIAVAFTEHLAVKNANQTLELAGVTVGPDMAPVDVPVVATGMRPGDGLRSRSLWKDIVPAEGWFVSASYTPDAGGAPVNIPESACSAQPDGSNCKSVRVDVSALPSGTGALKIKVHVVDRMRGGLAFAGGNIVCICTKAWWNDYSAELQCIVAIHELGHQFKMVCDGSGSLPDKVSSLYTGKGHVGNHCYFGIGELDTYVGATGAQCVMFGAVGVGSVLNFCDNCSPALTKMDLSAGWTS